jgi:hypothetical protein
MLKTAGQLISERATSGHTVKRLIVPARDKIEPIKDGEMQGVNHPMVRARIEKGKYEHIPTQASSCDMKEVFISGSYCTNPQPDPTDSKLDCVRGCKVIEIKPNNYEEIQMGRQQVAANAEG